MDTPSKYTTAKSVLKFRSETKISGSGKEDDVIVEAVTGGGISDLSEYPSPPLFLHVF
jgi:hypothetical protein